MTEDGLARRPVSAVFVDVENMAVHGSAGLIDFDVGRIMDRVGGMSRPIVRRAYADWAKLRTFRGSLLRYAFDQVQTTYVNLSKNTLDMQLCVDAVETVLLTPSIEVVFLVTSDSDYSPLARTLRKHGRQIIAIGWRDKSNEIFRAHCDEFIDYESLTGGAGSHVEPTAAAMKPAGHPDRRTPRHAQRRAIPQHAGADHAMPLLHDPRYDDEAGREAAEGAADTGLIATLGAGRATHDLAPSRRLREIDASILRLVDEFGPGTPMLAAQFIKAVRREHPGFTPIAFGFRTLTEFVEAHPLLRRDHGRGLNFSVILPDRPAPSPHSAASGLNAGAGGLEPESRPVANGTGPEPEPGQAEHAIEPAAEAGQVWLRVSRDSASGNGSGIAIGPVPGADGAMASGAMPDGAVDESQRSGWWRRR